MRVVDIKLLPDGSGRCRIHWFMLNDAGPIVMRHKIVPTSRGMVQVGGAVGRIACQPALKDVTPQPRSGSVHLTMHSDDVRAATCPECLATREAQDMLKELGERVEIGPKAPPTDLVSVAAKQHPELNLAK